MRGNRICGYKIIQEVPYYEILDVMNNREYKTKAQNIILITIRRVEFSFLSTDSRSITNIIRIILDGLRIRSVYAIGLQRFTLECKPIYSLYHCFYY